MSTTVRMTASVALSSQDPSAGWALAKEVSRPHR
jgi:hypothetical protein